jgi:hypothetical protein
MNVTPQNFETHPISKQHKIHLKKNFHFKISIKILLESCKLKISIGFKFQMNGHEKTFKKVTLGVPFIQNIKGTCIFTF